MVQESLAATFLRIKASGLMGEDVVVAFSAIVLAGFSACFFCFFSQTACVAAVLAPDFCWIV